LNTAGVLVRPDSPIRTAKDFKGKTIASPALHSLGTTALLPGSTRTRRFVDLSYVEIPFPAQPAALATGASMRSSRSSRSIARGENQSHRVADTARFRNASLPIFGLCTGLGQGAPDIVKKFVAVNHEANVWANKITIRVP